MKSAVVGYLAVAPSNYKFLLARRHKYQTPTFLVCTTHWRLTNNFLLPELTAWRPFRAQNIATSDLTQVQVFSGKLGAR